MTLDLRPEIARGLEMLASSEGLSVEDYLQRLVAKKLVPAMTESVTSNESGMVWEDGLYIYGAGTALPAGVLENSLRLSREERSQHIVGHRDWSDFDSSILIPAFYKFDGNHDSSAQVFRSASRVDSFCALRTLGEVYAVLTGLPVRPRITGPDGMAIVKQIREKLTIVSLSEEEYVSALQSVSETIVGGAAYDALIARCALKAQADVLLTWNVRDFTRFGSPVAQLVKTPFEILTL